MRQGEVIVNGLQQIGIGVADARAVFNWYRTYFGFDIRVFQDQSPATLMKRYTGGTVQNRIALLAMNMGGGGGLEIWQFRDRPPRPLETSYSLGDLGINMMKIRSSKMNELYVFLKAAGLKVSPKNAREKSFFMMDPWENWVQVVGNDYSFDGRNRKCGGVLGAIIGVSDMERSVSFYQMMLGFDTVVYDRSGIFDDISVVPGGNGPYRRMLLRRGRQHKGGFGELLGPCEIELIQALDRRPEVLFKDRWWGDLGYIHLCFDLYGMDKLKKDAISQGIDFQVDSGSSFGMGDAAGRFAYVEDPDGTLIELVETHRVPLIKSLGLFINLQKRNPRKPLPKWLVGMMRIHRRNRDI